MSTTTCRSLCFWKRLRGLSIALSQHQVSAGSFVFSSFDKNMKHEQYWLTVKNNLDCFSEKKYQFSWFFLFLQQLINRPIIPLIVDFFTTHLSFLFQNLISVIAAFFQVYPPLYQLWGWTDTLSGLQSAPLSGPRLLGSSSTPSAAPTPSPPGLLDASWRWTPASRHSDPVCGPAYAKASRDSLQWPLWQCPVWLKVEEVKKKII